MIGTLARLFRVHDQEQAARNIPPELLLAIQNAHVFERGEPDPEDGPRIIVTLSTVGQWRWAGVEDAEGRLQQMWPELGRVARQRAALLIRDRVAAEIRAAMQGHRRARGWLYDQDGRPWV